MTSVSGLVSCPSYPPRRLRQALTLLPVTGLLLVTGSALPREETRINLCTQAPRCQSQWQPLCPRGVPSLAPPEKAAQLLPPRTGPGICRCLQCLLKVTGKARGSGARRCAQPCPYGPAIGPRTADPRAGTGWEEPRAPPEVGTQCADDGALPGDSGQSSLAVPPHRRDEGLSSSPTPQLRIHRALDNPDQSKAEHPSSLSAAERRPSQLTFLTGEGKKKISQQLICLLGDSSLLPLLPRLASADPGVLYGRRGGRGNRELILPPSPMAVADVQINENKNSAWDGVLATACPRGSR